MIGERVRLQSNVYITAFSEIGDDVFVGPCAMTTNDDTMGRRSPTTRWRARGCGARAGSAAAR